MNYYIVSSKVPALSEGMIRKIPEHRAVIDRLMKVGQIMNYALAADRSRLWITLCADTETDAMDILAKLPLIEYLDFEISPLAFHLSPDTLAPAFSLN